MTSSPPDRLTRTALDHRIETAVGRSVEELRQQRDDGLLDPPHTALADAHRDLVAAERDIGFYRLRLARLASSDLPVDQALFARIDRTLDQLAQAARRRDAKQTTAAAALEPIEAGAPRQVPRQIPAKDAAALLAIAQGAKLHEHLVTHRLAVATPTRTRISYAQLQRLEANGFVERDSSHPVQAGQPVTLTDAGRAVLTSPRRAGAPGTTPAPLPPAFPAASRPRR
ncbi:MULTISPECIES: hypothetical protein [Streptomyces]|uniref:hypothetical protein n=1 Tax=Streptomyces TaxID=1883 RepID=UPI0006AD4DE1|nr:MULTISPECIES: hypothetical protein [Streptomyces]ALC26971.1 hypothetical protein ABE83_07645 [Streptomyces sp. CFMR 7]RZF06939.1 hypothetical protein C0R05_18780 [Streptomyces albidoflavus]